ncbi:c-type cytochrome [Dyadobacter sp. OTU695]|uniref:c-type cytochrome n=1 Tax=Dyadobacter sp. OTU695 TaxID=3043860 RepID=UPI00313E8464
MQGNTTKIMGSMVVFAMLSAMNPKVSQQRTAWRRPAWQRPDPLLADTLSQPGHFSFGRPVTEEEIAALDIDVRPDGRGLPKGEGNATEGKVIYALKCAGCHGATGTEGPNDRLVVGDTTQGQARRIKAIGNYWPYATTVFDYIRRAMPFNQPGSLTEREVYSLTAYLLHANGLWNEKDALNAKNLPKIKMPARDKFVPDDRKDGPEIR